jgi:hypothetical protein
MSPKSAKATRKLRGAQKWILDELRAVGPAARLSTSQLAKKISKARGKAFHKNSVYNALRILVRRGQVTMVRDGHEKRYQTSDGGRSAPSVPTARNASVAPASAGAGARETMLPHKLGLGEILIVGIDGDQVIAATNLHGRLVLEKYPIPG